MKSERKGEIGGGLKHAEVNMLDALETALSTRLPSFLFSHVKACCIM